MAGAKAGLKARLRAAFVRAVAPAAGTVVQTIGSFDLNCLFALLETLFVSLNEPWCI